MCSSCVEEGCSERVFLLLFFFFLSGVDIRVVGSGKGGKNVSGGCAVAPKRIASPCAAEGFGEQYGSVRQCV